MLPWRLMNEEAVDLAPRQPNPAIMSPENLGRLLDDYYALNGWDPENGFPQERTLHELNLAFTIPPLASRRQKAMREPPESCRLG